MTALSASVLVHPKDKAGSVAHSADSTRSTAIRPFIVVEEPRATGEIDAKKFGECLQLTVEELSLSGREPPKMVVYHVSQQSAQYLGIDSSSIYRNNGSAFVRYEMWVVGKPSHYAYTYLVTSLLQHHFQLPIDDQARSRVMKRVATALDETVEAHSFRWK